MSIAHEIQPIPRAYRDLLEGRTYAVLSTVMPDGQPQSTVVWCDVDGDCANDHCVDGYCCNTACSGSCGMLVCPTPSTLGWYEAWTTTI